MENPFSDSHKINCAEAIADALQELVCCEDGETDAYKALRYSVDTWVNYHAKELGKWKALQQCVKRSV